MDLQGVFVKFGGLLNLRFSCGIPREQAILRKSKTPRKSSEKWTFLTLAFYSAPSLHTVDLSWSMHSRSLKGYPKKGGVRCKRFDRTLSVVLKSLSLGFYRTFLGVTRGFDRTSWPPPTPQEGEECSRSQPRLSGLKVPQTTRVMKIFQEWPDLIIPKKVKKT